MTYTVDKTQRLVEARKRGYGALAHSLQAEGVPLPQHKETKKTPRKKATKKTTAKKAVAKKSTAKKAAAKKS